MSELPSEEKRAEKGATMTDANRILEIPLGHVKTDSTQPRKYFNEQSLRELADSIKTEGLLQPIMVKSNGNGSYLIVHGERRFRAHQKAALPTIKCIVTDKSDAQIQDARIVENLVRADLSDMELAKEFQKRVDAGQTHEQIANSIKKSRSFVTQRIALLRMPLERQNQLEQGKIGFADARVFVAVADSEKSTSDNSEVKQHGYAVTMESLEVYKLCNLPPGTEKLELRKGSALLEKLREAYRKDLETIRRALA